MSFLNHGNVHLYYPRDNGLNPFKNSAQERMATRFSYDGIYTFFRSEEGSPTHETLFIPYADRSPGSLRENNDLCAIKSITITEPTTRKEVTVPAWWAHIKPEDNLIPYQHRSELFVIYCVLPQTFPFPVLPETTSRLGTAVAATVRSTETPYLTYRFLDASGHGIRDDFHSVKVQRPTPLHRDVIHYLCDKYRHRNDVPTPETTEPALPAECHTCGLTFDLLRVPASRCPTCRTQYRIRIETV